MSSEQVAWYLSRNGQQFGPISNTKLDEFRSAGKLVATDLLWREGWPDWVPASKFRPDEVKGNAAYDANTKSLLNLTDPPQRWRQGMAISVTLAVVGMLGALGGGVLSNWQTFFPPKSVADVEQCDKSLSATTLGEYSGTYTGLVWDGDGETEVQLKLVRNGNTVQGSYFRLGVCGTVYADIEEGKLRFLWRWAGGSGRGIASQEGTSLIAVSGFGEATQGGGKLVFYQRAAE